MLNRYIKVKVANDIEVEWTYYSHQSKVQLQLNVESPSAAFQTNNSETVTIFGRNLYTTS